MRGRDTMRVAKRSRVSWRKTTGEVAGEGEERRDAYFEERPPPLGGFHHVGRAPGVWVLKGSHSGRRKRERRERMGRAGEKKRRSEGERRGAKKKKCGKRRLGCQSNPFPQGNWLPHVRPPPDWTWRPAHSPHGLIAAEPVTRSRRSPTRHPPWEAHSRPAPMGDNLSVGPS